jgi:hypothetical protein
LAYKQAEDKGARGGMFVGFATNKARMMFCGGDEDQTGVKIERRCLRDP